MNKNIILNIDCISVTAPFLTSVMESGNVSEEALYPFVDQYFDLKDGAQSGVGAIAFNTFCQESYVASNSMTDIFEICDKLMAAGGIPEFHKTYVYPFYRINKEYGIDPWDVFIRRCRERGAEAWVSVRMNDAHDTEKIECLMDTFSGRARYRDHFIGERYGYFWKCWNYAHDEVRERFLAYIEEMLARYDMDVLELDFMREIWCFDYVNYPDCASVMTEFMRAVRVLVNKYSDLHGHKIKLSVRLAREIDQCLIWGFDVRAWDRESLVDHITVTPRWETNDSDMPIEQWVTVFPNIEFAAGVEALVCSDPYIIIDDMYKAADADMVNAFAVQYYSQGAKQLYLYNYFEAPKRSDEEKLSRTWKILPHSGNLEDAMKYPRRHVVMYQDIAPEGCERYKPLPLYVDGTAELEIKTGPVYADSVSILCLEFSEGSPENVSISVNGTPVGEACSIVVSDERESHTIWQFAIPGSAMKTAQTVTFNGNGVTINHAEIRINLP